MPSVDAAFITTLLGKRVSVAPREGWTYNGESDNRPIENGVIRGIGLGGVFWLIIEDEEHCLRTKGFEINTIKLLDEP